MCKTFILFCASIFRQEDEKQKHVDKLRKRLEEKKKKLAQEKEPEEAEGGEEAEKKEKKKKKKKDKDKEKEKEENGEGKDEKKKKKKKKKDKEKDEDWRLLMFRKIIFDKEKVLFSFKKQFHEVALSYYLCNGEVSVKYRVRKP